MSYISPAIIAQKFIKQYYDILTHKPSDLHRFYVETSHFTHCDSSNHQSEEVKGVANIQQRIAELNLGGAVVDLSEGTLDAQGSDGSNVLLVVTGTLSHFGNTGLQQFVQTFFLESQIGQHAPSYVVRNSVFRLFNSLLPTSTHTHNSFTHPEVEKNIVIEPVVVQEEKIEIPIIVEEVKVEQIVIETPVIIEQIIVNKEETVVIEETNIASITNSYSDMVKKLGLPTNVPNKSSSQAPAKQSKQQSTASSKQQSKSSKSSKSSNSETPSSDNATIETKLTVVSKDDTNTPLLPAQTLYIQNLPIGCTTDKVGQIFGKFGKMARLDVNTDRCFAFVDYENVSSIANYLKISTPIKIDDNELKIEVRGTKKIVPKNSSGSGNKNRRGGRGNNNGGGESGSSSNVKSDSTQVDKQVDNGDKNSRRSNNNRSNQSKNTNVSSDAPKVVNTTKGGDKVQQDNKNKDKYKGNTNVKKDTNKDNKNKSVETKQQNKPPVVPNK